MLDLKAVFEFMKDKNPAARARTAAFLLAPGVILASVIPGMLGGSWAMNLDRPATLAPLRTEILANGRASPKPGVVLIVEPVSVEYRVQLQSSPSRLWSSLDEHTASANHGYITLDAGGISGKGPLLGVSDPVTIVVEGQLGDKVLLPGKALNSENWGLSSRRSDSVVSSALLSCAFAFGMSLAGGFPRAKRGKKTTS